MNISELKRQIEIENLNGNLLYVHDSRILRLINETRLPHNIILNRISDNHFQVLVFDERGYRVIQKDNLRECEACEYTLEVLRRNTEDVKRF